MRHTNYLLAFLSFILVSISSEAQMQDMNTDAPIIIPYAPTAGLPADSNADFDVKVKLSSSNKWVDLYEYMTYVNSSPSDKLVNNWTESSFVNFDFNGKIDVKITCNYCPSERIKISAKTTVIRPLSRKIDFTVDEATNSLQFSLEKPENLSVEINGDRYRNMHVFTNTPDPGPPANPDDYTSVDEMMASLQKNHGRKNDPDKVWYYAKKDNEVIYIGGNEVFRGGIRIEGKKNVTIRGRGIIDHQGMDKNYDNHIFPKGYDFLKCIKIKSTVGTTIDGIILNDAQQNPIHGDDNVNLTIKNLKSISRVKWGGSIYTSSSNGVVIDNCFLRSSDDCVPITPIHNGTTGSTKNVVIKNTSLYADVAHPIVLGWVGSNKVDQKGYIDNVLYENIDILEHDEGTAYYHGAIAIHCGEQNNCQNITFKDIRIEDFSNGSLLNIIVEPKWGSLVSSDGFRIQNITFDNVQYNGSGESRSHIKGIDDCRYVNGVHFKNLVVNGRRINSLDDYQIEGKDGFKTNDYIHDITFNEEEMKPLTTSGRFQIRHNLNQHFLSSTQESFLGAKRKMKTVTTPYPETWEISRHEGGFFTIKNYKSGMYLTSTKRNLSKDNCAYDQTIIAPAESDLDDQKWKIYATEDGAFRIINANGSDRSLSGTTRASISNYKHIYVGTAPWDASDNVKWTLVPVN